MRIALITDAWHPQVNGVVRTLGMTVDLARRAGHEVHLITPDLFPTIPCPSYPEIRLAAGAMSGVARRLKDFAPEAVHIATEGPLGWAARRWCRRRAMPFTTSFHTRFPDYIALRTRLPSEWFWPIVRRFHAPAERVFAATATLESELSCRGLRNTHRWSRGVDLELFSPAATPLAGVAAFARPIALYVGRVAKEKNIEAFLALQMPGSRVVVGDGPARAELERRFPAAHFLGALSGRDLAGAYAAADVLVFPSLTDTFGLVIIEALASGLPVAAYPVPGPLDILGANGRGTRGERSARIGALSERLDEAVSAALSADRVGCATEGRLYSWQVCTEQFFGGLAPRRSHS